MAGIKGKPKGEPPFLDPPCTKQTRPHVQQLDNQGPFEPLCGSQWTLKSALRYESPWLHVYSAFLLELSSNWSLLCVFWAYAISIQVATVINWSFGHMQAHTSNMIYIYIYVCVLLFPSIHARMALDNVKDEAGYAIFPLLVVSNITFSANAN